MERINHRFSRISNVVTKWAGSPLASVTAFLLVLTWIVGGFFVNQGFLNSSYQLLINSGTTVITFIMVFVIQHATNVGTSAMQLKLDELIAKIDQADNRFIALEEQNESELRRMKTELMENIDVPTTTGHDRDSGQGNGEGLAAIE